MYDQGVFETSGCQFGGNWQWSHFSQQRPDYDSAEPPSAAAEIWGFSRVPIGGVEFGPIFGEPLSGCTRSPVLPIHDMRQSVDLTSPFGCQPLDACTNGKHDAWPRYPAEYHHYGEERFGSPVDTNHSSSSYLTPMHSGLDSSQTLSSTSYTPLEASAGGHSQDYFPRFTTCAPASFGARNMGVALQDIQPAMHSLAGQVDEPQRGLTPQCRPEGNNGQVGQEALTPPYGGDNRMMEDAVDNASEFEEEEEPLIMPEDDAADSDFRPSEARNSHRRASSNRSRRSTNLTKTRSKVSKRSPARGSSSSSSSLRRQISQQVAEKKHEEVRGNKRPYTCPARPYGCEIDFASKNEWKRHVHSQHLTLGFWRCDLCPDADANPNNFNRKDLFTQHLRRMHGPAKHSGPDENRNCRRQKAKMPKLFPAQRNEKFEEGIVEICRRCWVQCREAPSRIGCAFCRDTFQGDKAIHQWLEHCGQHLVEASHKSAPGDVGLSWSSDTTFRDWLSSYGLVEHTAESRWKLAERSFADDYSPIPAQDNGTEEDAQGDPE